MVFSVKRLLCQLEGIHPLPHSPWFQLLTVEGLEHGLSLAPIDAARRLVKGAFRKGADWVILPEFFTSAMGFLPKMNDVALPLEGRAMQMLKDLSREHNGVVGGSYIALRGLHSYNTFVLALPNGTTLMHDKDQPTMWENCYYQGGTDEGILETPIGRTGVAMCWEFIRTRTVRRLLGRVDLVVGGSCWWTLPEKRLPGLPDRRMEIPTRTQAEVLSAFGYYLDAGGVLQSLAT